MTLKRVQTGLLVALGAATLAVSAYAATLETVTVTGSRAVSEKTVGRSMTGAPIREVTLSYAVSVADLDLKTAAGKAEAEKRVTAAAKAACTELDKMTALNPSSPDHAVCVKRAVDDAMAKVR